MKRRVARDHSNKRVLRTLSAQHAFSHDAFQVLCDSSFLRTLLQLQECTPLYHTKKDGYIPSQRRNRTTSQSRSPSPRLPALSPFALLKSLTLQALEVLDKSAGGGSAGGEGKRSKQLSHIRWVYLPATERVLRQMVSKDEEEQEKGKKEKLDHNLHNSSKMGARRKMNSHPLKGLSAMRLEKLFASLTPLANPSKESTKEVEEVPSFLRVDTNEAKSIARFVEYHSQCRHQEAARALKNVTKILPDTASQLPRTSFLFIGTQSHDVRRLLPDGTALLRLTHHPSAMWAEIKKEHYQHYDEDRYPRSCSHVASLKSKERKGKENKNVGDAASEESKQYTNSSSALSTSPPISLCPADAAFIRYLDHNKSARRPTPRNRKCSGGESSYESKTSNISSSSSSIPRNYSNLTPSSEDDQNTQIGSKKENGGKKSEKFEDPKKSASAGLRRRPREPHPNPLSVKKKQKKEVLRL